MNYHNRTEILKKITEEDKLATNNTDNRILTDMGRRKDYTNNLQKINPDDSGFVVTIAFKEAVAKKLRLWITEYSQGKYWYLLSNKGYIISFKNYNISKADQYYWKI